MQILYTLYFKLNNIGSIGNGLLASYDNTDGWSTADVSDWVCTADASLIDSGTEWTTLGMSSICFIDGLTLLSNLI